MSFRDKRRVAIWGGLLVGLGLGSCLAWSLNIFEIAHPQVGVSCDGSGCSTTLYPYMALTVFAVLVFSGAFGLGLGLVASALIPNEDVRQYRAATGADPADAASSKAVRPPTRTIFGFVRGGR